ncbi:MAG TPA: protein-L-isoaspartate(D-aspartate) O-methyltransferase [Cytophagaceae bacterium]|jgi:protein-L-isoaspartate(D-aspartate) O-methyltransferase|nr:protein-L-isoaspartate(D-aspartate) O-methyltransferase [Cytophagaceae bacterium]
MEDTYKHKGLRKQLVKKLLEKGIKDVSVLKAIEKVPRHFFFESALETHAYEDKAFPIDEGQTISQPFTVAFQTELLKIKKGDKVLEVGTGSGYQACILAELGAKLYTIEYIRKLYDKSTAMIRSMGYKVDTFCGDGSLGIPKYAPYNKIIVTAGAPIVPDELLKQLTPGGILVIPVGDTDSQKMLQITKLESGKIVEKEFGYFKFVPLKGKDGWK